MGENCKTLAVIYAILGVIASFFMAFVYGRRVVGTSTYSSQIYYKSSWLLTIVIFVAVIFFVSMVSVALYTIGDIYDKVCALSYNGNSLTMSKDATKGLEQLGKEAEEKQVLGKGGWKCPDCGRIHRSYETSCVCGRSKE